MLSMVLVINGITSWMVSTFGKRFLYLQVVSFIYRIWLNEVVSMERNILLDKLKGWAIFLVVLGHALSYNQDGLLFKIIYSFHMPLFMFISGILSFGKTSDYRKFISRRFVGLIIPYIAWQPIFLIINASNLNLSTLSLADIAINTLIFPRYGNWFLYVLFINLILLVICNKTSRYIGDISYFLMFGIQFLIFKLLPGGIYFGADMVSETFIYVALGYLTAKYKNMSFLSKPLLGLSVFAFPILTYFKGAFIVWEATLLNSYGLPGDNAVKILYMIPIAISGIRISYYIVETFKKLTCLEALGKNSLIIYTTHGLFFMLVPQLPEWSRVFALIIFSISMGLLTAKFIEQSKSLSYILAGTNRIRSPKHHTLDANNYS